MTIEVFTSGGWVSVPPQMEEKARHMLEQPIWMLEMMMACDTGWTGLIFEALPLTFRIYKSTEHIVDIRSAQKGSF